VSDGERSSPREFTCSFRRASTVAWDGGRECREWAGAAFCDYVERDAALPTEKLGFGSAGVRGGEPAAENRWMSRLIPSCQTGLIAGVMSRMWLPRPGPMSWSHRNATLWMLIQATGFVDLASFEAESRPGCDRRRGDGQGGDPAGQRAKDAPLGPHPGIAGRSPDRVRVPSLKGGRLPSNKDDKRSAKRSPPGHLKGPTMPPRSRRGLFVSIFLHDADGFGAERR